jgi:hypothetical protein
MWARVERLTGLCAGIVNLNVSAEYMLILNRFEIQFDGFPDIVYRLFPAIPLANTARQGRRDCGIAAFFAWFQHNSD